MIPQKLFRLANQDVITDDQLAEFHMIVDQNYNPNELDSNGMSLLMCAAVSGNVQVVNFLLGLQNIDPNLIGTHWGGRCALSYAAGSSNPNNAIIQQLINRAIDDSHRAQGKSNFQPFEEALRKGNYDAAALLVDRHPDKDAILERLLFKVQYESTYQQRQPNVIVTRAQQDDENTYTLAQALELVERQKVLNSLYDQLQTPHQNRYQVFQHLNDNGQTFYPIFQDVQQEERLREAMKRECIQQAARSETLMMSVEDAGRFHPTTNPHQALRTRDDLLLAARGIIVPKILLEVRDKYGDTAFENGLVRTKWVGQQDDNHIAEDNAKNFMICKNIQEQLRYPQFNPHLQGADHNYAQQAEDRYMQLFTFLDVLSTRVQEKLVD